MNLDNAPLSDRDVILVDLAGTAENRRVMRAMSRWIVRLDVFAKRMRGAPPPKVLVFAPAADGKSVEWPVGADLIFTDELLDPDAIRCIDAWAEPIATRLVRELAPLWPEVEGISLGPLNLLQTIDFLLEYAQVTESLRRVLLQGNGRCIILSGYPPAAEAIRRDVANHARQTVVNTLPGYRPSQRRRSNAQEPPLAWDARLEQLRARVLIVSESRPMAGLFAAVEPHLEAADLSPILRIQYGTGEPRLELRPGVSLLHLARPELVRSEARGYREVYQRNRARFLDAVGEDSPYHPPLDLLLGALFTNVLPHQARHIEEMRRIMRATRPELVVVGNDRWWLGMAAVLVARQEGIPTLAVQDGVAWDTLNWRTPATADRVAVNGTQLEGFLRSGGMPEEQLAIVGQPRYDTYNAEAAQRVRPQVRARLGLAETDFAVLFATQPNQDASYARRVADAILAVPGVRLLLRPHPSTVAREHARITRLVDGHRVLSAVGGEVFDFIAAADVVVVQNSTVALEAALLDRPVITANFTGLPEFVSYAQLGISTEAKDPAAVTELVKRARDGGLPSTAGDEKARSGLFYLIGPTDGRAAQRVADVIGDMLAQRASR